MALCKLIISWVCGLKHMERTDTQTIIIIIDMLMPVELNSFTHIRALLVLHNRGIFAHATSVTGLYSSN